MNKLGMMDHLKVSSKLLVVILESAETVRAEGYNLLDSILLKYLNIIPNQLIKNIFIPQSAERISTAFLFSSQYAPGEIGSV